MEENRPEKVAKTEEKSTVTQETVKKQETSEENAVMEDKKIISDVKAEMAVDKKTEDTDSSQEKRKMISQGKAPIVEEQIIYLDYDDYEDLLDEFLAEKRPKKEMNVDDQSWTGAEKLFQDIGADTVYTAYTEAFQSKNIEKLDRELKLHGEYSGILVMFSMQCHKKYKKTDLYFLLNLLNKYVIVSEFDVFGFSASYDVTEEYQPTLQRGMWHVMFIFDQADEVHKPADMVAKAIVGAYTTRIWGEEVFSTLYTFLRSRNVSKLRVAFATVTALVKRYKDESNQELSTVIHKTKIVEAMSKINVPKLPTGVQQCARRCAEELTDLPNPPESVSVIAADSASGKPTELEKQTENGVSIASKDRGQNVKWSLPNRGNKKLNTAWSLKGSNLIGGGGVIRNDDGSWLAGFSMKFHSVSPEAAELLTIREGLITAKKFNIRRLELETDVDELKTMIQYHEDYLNHELGMIIQDIVDLLKKDWIVIILRAKRAANAVAYNLAKFGLQLTDDDIKFHYFIPPCARDAFERDCERN